MHCPLSRPDKAAAFHFKENGLPICPNGTIVFSRFIRPKENLFTFNPICLVLKIYTESERNSKIQTSFMDANINLFNFPQRF